MAKLQELVQRNKALEERNFKLTGTLVELRTEVRVAESAKGQLDKLFNGDGTLIELSDAAALNRIASLIIERHKVGKHNLYSERPDPPQPAHDPPRTVHVLTRLMSPSKPAPVSLRPLITSPTAVRPNPSLVPTAVPAYEGLDPY
jgi:hypothetical protein